MGDTPVHNRAARVIAENAYVSYCRQATMQTRPIQDQPIPVRLVEAIRPQIGSGSPGAIIEAANTALSVWEQWDPEIRGPRIVPINQDDGSVIVG